MKAQKGVSQTWLASFGLGFLSGVSISSVLCFLFPKFFAELANPPGHLAGLEEVMQSYFVMSGVLTVVCTLLFRWFLKKWQLREAGNRANNGGWWPEKRA